MKPKGSQFAGMSDAMWANDAANPDRIQAEARATHWNGEKMTEADKAEGVRNKAMIQSSKFYQPWHGGVDVV